MNIPIYAIGGVLASVFALLTLGLAIKKKPQKSLLRILAALWLILPPIYFFIEFHVTRASIRHDPKFSTEESIQRELGDMKDSQEQAARIWAGVAAILGALYLKSDDDEKKSVQ